MRQALNLAENAWQAGEVPVGAVLLDQRQGHCLAEGWNQSVGLNDPTAHAEIVALRAGAQRQGNYRLPGTVLYVTLEPCIMCVGALIQARVAQIVYAATDPKVGAIGGTCDLTTLAGINHRPQVVGGILADQATDMLQRFFRERR